MRQLQKFRNRLGSVVCVLGALVFCSTAAFYHRETGTGKVRDREVMSVHTGEASDLQTGGTTGKGEVRKIAITFDDGPTKFCTDQLLDGLKERGVHATFFVTGQNAERYPDLIKRMSEEGHLVGNHTYSHIQLKKSNREEFKQELIKTNEIINSITGEEVLFVRPPYGTWDKSFESELNMFPVLWNIDPLDWCTDNADCVTRKVVSKAQDNAIILMHDNYDSTVTAALRIIDELEKQGYEFVTVEEILFD